MSIQAQPQQQPQQPVQVYPTNQPVSSHHSNGSFGAVFIVLAIILVISVVACFLGRLCNKRYNKHNSNQRPPRQHRPQIHNLHPRDEADIEVGADKRMPPPIIRTKRRDDHSHGEEGTGSHSQPHVIGNMRDFQMKHEHGGEIREDA